MTTEKIHPLHIRATEHDPENPFDGDLFERRKIADRLTGLVERIADGCVLAIDAPWGEGKSWFGRNWVSDLRSKEYSVAYIDAFRQDYVDDPFLMVCSEIISEIGDGDGTKGKLSEAGLKVAKALLPGVAKAALNLGGRLLLGVSDISGEYQKAAEEVDKGISEAVEKHLAKRLDAYAEDKRSVEGFAEVLREHAGKLDKPLIVVVDELDRCRPDFAVRTIERIKHFFDVPGVVFVLLVNRPQLEAAVRGIYGSGVDAGAYLGKFVQFWLRLPKARSIEMSSQDHNQIYCQELARRFGLTSQGHRDFQQTFAAIATCTGLSLRDMERGYTLFSLAQPINASGGFMAWIVYLKLKHPELMDRLLLGEASAHSQARKILAPLLQATNGFWIFPFADDLHRFHEQGFETPLSEEASGVLRSMGSFSVQPQNFLPRLCKRVDLSVDN